MPQNVFFVVKSKIDACLLFYTVTEMLVNVLNICSDDELMSEVDDLYEGNNSQRTQQKSFLIFKKVRVITISESHLLKSILF